MAEPEENVNISTTSLTVKGSSSIDCDTCKPVEKKTHAIESRKRKLSDVTSSSHSVKDKRARLQALVDDRMKRGLTAPPPAAAVRQLIKDERGSAESSKLSSPQLSRVHTDLALLKKLAFDPAGLVFTASPVKDKECEEYAGHEFSLNNRVVKFRVAKTTPTKNGQFVTFWKRIGKGPIQPYDVKDNIDLFVVCVRDGEKFGHFVFTKKAFQTEGVLSVGGKGGKRAIRVYAPWVKPESNQAVNTQAWQSKYFVKLMDKSFQPDIQRIKRLYAP